MEDFREAEFRSRVIQALEQVKRLLDTTRNPVLAEEVSHAYNDKYTLVEHAANAGLVSLVDLFVHLDSGNGTENWKIVHNWCVDEKKPVTLRLDVTEKCDFDREEMRMVDSNQEYVTEVRKSGILSRAASTVTSKTVTKITEYYWNIEVAFRLHVFCGSAPTTDSQIFLRSRTGRTEIVTTTKTSPRPKVTVRPSIDLNVSDFVANLTPTLDGHFAINRLHLGCHTPRRNLDVERLLAFFARMESWCNDVLHSFITSSFPLQSKHNYNLGAIDDFSSSAQFVPVLPFLEETNSSASRPHFSMEDAAAFRAEHKRLLDEGIAKIRLTFPVSETKEAQLISVSEVVVCAVSSRLACVSIITAQCIHYVEHMLWSQLVVALGKVISISDLDDYMRFQNRKLFAPNYLPHAFCYDIRRAGNSPQGTLSIVLPSNNPIATCVRIRDQGHGAPMRFPLSAATMVSFSGRQYLHGYISHQFSTEKIDDIKLCARARQFSSFVLMLGTIPAPNLFEPKDAIIIKNQDELIIPLLLEPLPTPKEFRDAIESLSPEQQRFAKAFRSMQLASTLFSICVIQIKPQLETLLKLPPDSLTKEIALTEDLMDLFIKYQIPSDLLTYDGPSDAPVDAKRLVVKNYVASIQSVIEKMKQQQIDSQRQRAEHTVYRDLEEHLEFGSAQPMTMACSFAAAPPSMMRKAVPMAKKQMMQLQLDVSVASSQQPGSAPLPQPVQAPLSSESSVPMPQASGLVDVSDDISSVDYTNVPAALDRKFEILDKDSKLRPTTIVLGETWTKKYQDSLLQDPASKTLGIDARRSERNQAMDLLDALSRSGELVLAHSDLHVIVAVSHCFDNTVMKTLIQDNINPVERIERSTLIVASTIHGEEPDVLIAASQLYGVKHHSPNLFVEADADRREDRPI